MHRRAFIRRMIFAGLATWFLDLPLPREQPNLIFRVDLPTGEWVQLEYLIRNATLDLDPMTLPEGVTVSFEEQCSPGGGPMVVCWVRSRTSIAPSHPRAA